MTISSVGPSPQSVTNNNDLIIITGNIRKYAITLPQAQLQNICQHLYDIELKLQNSDYINSDTYILQLLQLLERTGAPNSILAAGLCLAGLSSINLEHYSRARSRFATAKGFNGGGQDALKQIIKKLDLGAYENIKAEANQNKGVARHNTLSPVVLRHNTSALRDALTEAKLQYDKSYRSINKLITYILALTHNRHERLAIAEITKQLQIRDIPASNDLVKLYKLRVNAIDNLLLTIDSDTAERQQLLNRAIDDCSAVLRINASSINIKETLNRLLYLESLHITENIYIYSDVHKYFHEALLDEIRNLKALCDGEPSTTQHVLEFLKSVTYFIPKITAEIGAEPAKITAEEDIGLALREVLDKIIDVVSHYKIKNATSVIEDATAIPNLLDYLGRAFSCYSNILLALKDEKSQRTAAAALSKKVINVLCNKHLSSIAANDPDQKRLDILERYIHKEILGSTAGIGTVKLSQIENGHETITKTSITKSLHLPVIECGHGERFARKRSRFAPNFEAFGPIKANRNLESALLDLDSIYKDVSQSSTLNLCC